MANNCFNEGTGVDSDWECFVFEHATVLVNGNCVPSDDVNNHWYPILYACRGNFAVYC